MGLCKGTTVVLSQILSRSIFYVLQSLISSVHKNKNTRTHMKIALLLSLSMITLLHRQPDLSLSLFSLHGLAMLKASFSKASLLKLSSLLLLERQRK